MRIVIVAVLVIGCGEAQPEPDAGRDDAGRVELDGGMLDPDAGVDAGRDLDAGDDGGACTCSTNDRCCDGCMPENEGLDCFTPRPGTGGDATCVAGICEGTPCECTTGPCCEGGCFFRPSTAICDENYIYASRCDGEGTGACPGFTERIERSFGERHCSGSSAECTGAVEHVRHVGSSCWSAANPVYCVEDSPEPIAAHCTHVCERP